MQTRIWCNAGRAAAVVMALSLAACASTHHAAPYRILAYENPAARAAREAADWSLRVDLTIEMMDYGYRPKDLRLKAGQPYRVTPVSYGAVNH